MHICPLAMHPPSNEEGTTRWAKFLYVKHLISSMIPYDIDFDALSKKVKNLGFQDILIQLPEGMQIYAEEIAENFKNFNVFISSNPCYGACDIEVHPNMLTIQFGHSKIPNIKYPENIIFVEAFSNAPFDNALNSFLKITNCKNVGILASVQHIKAIEYVRSFLEEHNVHTLVGKGDSRITYPGQVLGCNFSAAREVKEHVDCFVFLGTGEFHALGAKIVSGKDVFVLDPYSRSVKKVDDENFLKRRYMAIARAKDAQKLGIIASSKIGQRRLKLAKNLKNMIERAGKRAYLIMADNIVPENFYYGVDAYVNTACPRITYDDYSRFNKVVLSPIELLIALGIKDWSSFSFDEIVEVD